MPLTFLFSSVREHPGGGPTGPMAARSGAYVAGLSQRGPGGLERPEGDLPSQRAATSSGSAGVSAAK